MVNSDRELVLSPKQREDYQEAISYQPAVREYFNCGFVSADLIKIMDWKTGEGIIVPREMMGEQVYHDQYLDPYLAEGKAEPKVAELEISNEDRELMIKVMDECSLPRLVAVHLVLNCHLTEEEIYDQYGKVQTQTPALMALYGASMQGKTMLAVELRRRGEAVVSIDEFSPDGLEKYWEEIKNANLVTTEHSTAEIVDAINNHNWSVRDGAELEKKANEWSMRKALDRISHQFQNGIRPEILVIDFPGMWIPDDFGDMRMMNIFDWVAKFSMTTLEMSRFCVSEKDGQTTSFQLFDGKMATEVIEDYLRQWQTFREMMMNMEGCRDGLLCYGMMENEESAMICAESMYYWALLLSEQSNDFD